MDLKDGGEDERKEAVKDGRFVDRNGSKQVHHDGSWVASNCNAQTTLAETELQTTKYLEVQGKLTLSRSTFPVT